MIKFQCRQGDVLIQKCSDQVVLKEETKTTSLEGAPVPGTVILALGEVTGHRHAIHSKNAFIMEGQYEPKFYIRIFEKTELVHEEHTKIKMPVGTWEVTRQLQYSPGEIRQVAD